MPWKLLIWIAGLFVASLSWGSFLVTSYYPFPDERVNPILLEAITFGLSLFIISGIVAGVCFAFMKFRKEKAVKALWIWTFVLLMDGCVMLNY